MIKKELPQEKEQLISQKKMQEQLKQYHTCIFGKPEQYRSPICCVFGHVDTGKTALINNICQMKSNWGYSGSFGQQIRSNILLSDKLIEEVSKCKNFYEIDAKLPKILFVDTPGQKDSRNLRQMAVDLCDLAILVIDLQHGLEQQTFESLQLLKDRKTPFVIGINKIDRSTNWKPNKNCSSYLTLKMQPEEALHDYQMKLQKIVLELSTKGYKTVPYWENQNPSDFISLVPISSFTGEGIPDLLSVIVKYSTTLPQISKRIKVKENIFKCTVMQVKMTEDDGTFLDCMLIDGRIKKDDQIVAVGFQGPIISKVKAILTPRFLTEMKLKGSCYLNHQEIWGANQVKIVADNIDNVVSGTPLIIASTQEELESAKVKIANELQNYTKRIKLEKLGVAVVASNLKSLLDMLDYLTKEQVPVSYLKVGSTVSVEDVTKFNQSILYQVPERRKKEQSLSQLRLACLFALDVTVLEDSQKYANNNQITILQANAIQSLADLFTKYVKVVQEAKEKRKSEQGKKAVFPCILKTISILRKSDPLVFEVIVQNGILKQGTPLVLYLDQELVDLKKPVESELVKVGIVQQIKQNNQKLTETAKSPNIIIVSIKEHPNIDPGYLFNKNVKLASLISRKSIDCLKEYYKDELTRNDWLLVVELKKYFGIT